MSGSISDAMLQAGCIPAYAAVHGEQIIVLSGTDAGKPGFIAVRTIEPDMKLDSNLGVDLRSKQMLRFTGLVPALSSQDVVQTGDGKKWHAVRAPQDGYLTTDFELIEILGKDQ